MKHQWRDDNCLGPIKVCSRCPEVWWMWASPAEPSAECVPIDVVFFTSAAPRGDTA